MTDIYFANVEPKFFPPDWDWENKPLNLLVSFHYLEVWKKRRQKVQWPRFDKHMLDSGAFSAYTQGASIDIDALIAECKNPMWNEAVGLDVIGSWEGSKKNMDYMRLHGAGKAMPVFHIGDPMELLTYYCGLWEKVGLSCMFGEPRRESLRFYEQCFARAWPHRFHSFGWVGEDALTRFPFDSADASSWLVPVRYGRYFMKSKKGGKTSIERAYFKDDETKKRIANDHGMLQAVTHFYNMQQSLAVRWSRELKVARESFNAKRKKEGK